MKKIEDYLNSNDYYKHLSIFALAIGALSLFNGNIMVVTLELCIAVLSYDSYLFREKITIEKKGGEDDNI